MAVIHSVPRARTRNGPTRNVVVAADPRDPCGSSTDLLSRLPDVDRTACYPSVLVDSGWAVDPSLLDDLRLGGIPVLVQRSNDSKGRAHRRVRRVTDARFFIRSAQAEVVHVHSSDPAAHTALLVAARLLSGVAVVQTRCTCRPASSHLRSQHSTEALHRRMTALDEAVLWPSAPTADELTELWLGVRAAARGALR